MEAATSRALSGEPFFLKREAPRYSTITLVPTFTRS